MLWREEVWVCLDQLGVQLSAGGLAQHGEALDFIPSKGKEMKRISCFTFLELIWSYTCTQTCTHECAHRCTRHTHLPAHSHMCYCIPPLNKIYFPNEVISPSHQASRFKTVSRSSVESNPHFHILGADSVLEMLVCGSYSLLTRFRRNMTVKQKREKAQEHQEKHTEGTNGRRRL